MIIRPATIDDCKAIAQIHIAGWQTTYRGLVPDAYLDAMQLDERTERWRKTMADKSMDITLLETADGTVGFCAHGHARTPIPGHTGRINPFSAEIYAIYFLPAARGQGYGRALLLHVAKELVKKHHSGMALWVLDKNPNAIAFYEKLGGQLIANRMIDIGGANLKERAYGWRNLRSLT